MSMLCRQNGYTVLLISADGNYRNPVLPMNFSDPDPIRVGEDYYLVSSSFTYLPGVLVLHSRDLVHWERIGNCVTRLPYLLYEVPAYGCGAWAPSLRYHDVIFYALFRCRMKASSTLRQKIPPGPGES